jgi:ABC-type amino acid transport substrate-binding protein
MAISQSRRAKMHRLVLCAVISVLFLFDAANAQEKLRFSGFDAPNLTPFAEKILRQAYAELGIGIEVVMSNPHRALLDAASGKTDGELVRVREIETQHESLIRVDVPVVVARTFAYANRLELKGKSFANMKHLRVGHVAGAFFAQELSAGFAEIWAAETPEQLFEMLQRNRIDLVIVGEGTATRVIRELKIDGVFALRPSLQEVAFYHFLHEKHAGLVPRIEAALKRVLLELKEQEPESSDRSPSHRDGTVLHKTGLG